MSRSRQWNVKKSTLECQELMSAVIKNDGGRDGKQTFHRLCAAADGGSSAGSGTDEERGKWVKE